MNSSSGSSSRIAQRVGLGITLLLLCAFSFYSGYINAMNEDLQPHSQKSKADCTNKESSPQIQQRIDARVEEELQKFSSTAKRKSRHQQATQDDAADAIFPKATTSEYAAGILRVSKAELLREYDFGVPNKHKPGEDDTDAIILYNHAHALPSGRTLLHEAIHGRSENGHQVIANTTVSSALSKCDALNVIFMPLQNTATNNKFPECYVIMSDFESYHINRWMRVPDFATTSKGKDRVLNHNLPLRHVGRITLATKGVDELEVPLLWKNFEKKEKSFLFEHFDIVKTYLENVDSVLKDLKKILKDRNVVKSDNTVIVMTVNQGQSELLSNFICSARRRGFDVGSVLVFPTDLESKALAEGLGVATYYDEKNFGRLPTGEAKVYGDPIFCQMMFAKILSVAYVTLLGHDVLFQDVDIVWYKNPLQFFHNTTNEPIQKFDILFQHDGSAHLRYNPLSANSGFYYVRYNKRTQYLFTSFIYHGALVRKTKSHQHVLIQLLLEHSSMFGLNVKVFDKVETDMFPGGFHYHQDWDTMRSIINGTSNAYLMHMSWTENKVNKLLFLRQMGDWCVNDQCINVEIEALKDIMKDGSLIEPCCSAEPLFSCHFRDKPSIKPCPDDTPLIDPKKKRNFWG